MESGTSIGVQLRNMIWATQLVIINVKVTGKSALTFPNSNSEDDGKPNHSPFV
jgi:hypothetical protein